MSQTKQNYPQVKSDVSFPQLEREVLDFWQRERVFEQSVAMRPATKSMLPAINGDSSNAYVFYDGPPFANGLPHHGHLLTGYVKDMFARYQTMKGKRVERRFGWDCHGLPAEMEAEKQLGVSGRANIINYGVEKFNAHCRTSVMAYRNEWEEYVNRQARWVDFENDYKTMDTPYMESVLWAFAELHKKGLIYEGFKVMPYSWAAETVLSTSEIRMDDATREKVDKAVTVAFKLKEVPKKLKELADNFQNGAEIYLLAWTTTPWTLPSNLALAVSEKVSYSAFECFHKNGKIDWFIQYCNAGNLSAAKELLERNTNCEIGQIIDITHANEDKLSSLVGLQYEPLFPYFANHPNAFKVLDGSDFIEEGAGTGIVHMAPAFGEDDMRICAANGIEVVIPVDGEGKYSDAIYDLTSIQTKRCILRTPTDSDASNFLRLHTNPQVMATVNDGLMSEAEANEDFARNLAHFKQHSYGQFAVYNRDNGAFMGRAGLSFSAQTDGFPARPTLRCALLPEFWHGGYGGELCAAAIEYGFNYLGFSEIAGGALENNPRSHEMMKRLGMKYVQDVMFKRSMGPYFLITKQDFVGDNAIIVNIFSLKGLNVIQETEKLNKLEKEDQQKYEKSKYSIKNLNQFGLANIRIAKWLNDKGVLIKEDNDFRHNYPHCWRTDKPIIYRAMSSWFVDVPKIKDRMIELNQQINWIPEHVKDGRFGKWLEGAREWSISRSRFWGCPIPVWRSDNPENTQLYVFESIAELEQFFGVKVEDLHKPFIDTLTKPDPTNAKYTLSRVDEVFDCWFESGSMPYAQVHYPFENKEWFEANFPADFIVEYEAQTRGWFYNMMVLSVALFDRIPFKNCICHGVVLDGEGRKLSKKLKNYVSPMELFDEYGSDALRWFLMSSTIMRGNELFLDAEGVFIRDAVRLYIKPLWNAYNFFCLYANADGVVANFDLSSANIMDKYILAKLKACVGAVEIALDAYDTPTACAIITAFLEVLNNWYIRRNRGRFWGEAVDSDKISAYNTLYSVLHVMCRLVAPLLPQISEVIFAGLINGGDFERNHSVHLTDFPTELAQMADDANIMQAMDRVQDICNTAHAIRNEVNIRTRQPLSKLTIYGVKINDNADYFKALIADEVNVKEVMFSDDLEAVATRNLKISFPLVGKRLPAKMKAIAAAAKSGNWKIIDANQNNISHNSDNVSVKECHNLNMQRDIKGKKMIHNTFSYITKYSIEIEGEVLHSNEYEFTLQSTIKDAKDVAVRSLPAQDGLLVLDTNLSEALISEGVARDVVRLIQQSRKDAGLNVADRIALMIDAPANVLKAITEHQGYVCEQTLTESLIFGISSNVGTSATQHSASHNLGDAIVALSFNVAANDANIKQINVKQVAG